MDGMNGTDGGWKVGLVRRDDSVYHKTFQRLAMTGKERKASSTETKLFVN